MLFLVKMGREMKKIITLAYHRVYKFKNENMLRNTDTARCVWSTVATGLRRLIMYPDPK